MRLTLSSHAVFKVFVKKRSELLPVGARISGCAFITHPPAIPTLFSGFYFLVLKRTFLGRSLAEEVQPAREKQAELAPHQEVPARARLPRLSLPPKRHRRVVRNPDVET